jgi:V/A-type H+-transporting ATPase subunit E
MTAETSIQPLLDKIKREGIEEANKAAEEILEQARFKAENILKKGEAKAQKEISEATADIEKKKRAFEESMHHAGRNLMISLNSQIRRVCEHIMERHVAEALTPAFMRDIILKLIDKWDASTGEKGIELLLSEEDCQRLEAALHESLKRELKQGITLRPMEHIQAGFRIGEKDGHMHYDFTHKTIAEILSEYLSPRIAQYLEDAEE